MRKRTLTLIVGINILIIISLMVTRTGSSTPYYSKELEAFNFGMFPLFKYGVGFALTVVLFLVFWEIIYALTSKSEKNTCNVKKKKTKNNIMK